MDSTDNIVKARPIGRILRLLFGSLVFTPRHSVLFLSANGRAFSNFSCNRWIGYLLFRAGHGHQQTYSFLQSNSWSDPGKCTHPTDVAVR